MDEMEKKGEKLNNQMDDPDAFRSLEEALEKGIDRIVLLDTATAETRRSLDLETVEQGIEETSPEREAESKAPDFHADIHTDSGEADGFKGLMIDFDETEEAEGSEEPEKTPTGKVRISFLQKFMKKRGAEKPVTGTAPEHVEEPEDEAGADIFLESGFSAGADDDSETGSEVGADDYWETGFDTGADDILESEIDPATDRENEKGFYDGLEDEVETKPEVKPKAKTKTKPKAKSNKKRSSKAKAVVDPMDLWEDDWDEGEDDDWALDDLGSDEFYEEDEKYFSSTAYKRSQRRGITAEEREERRAKRVAAFWDFIDRNRRQVRWLFVGIVVLIGVVIVSLVIRNWTYSEYKELVLSEKEDTISVSYANINGRVLKYGVDSAMLVDHNNDMLWTASYDMSAPKLVLCGDTFAIYDSKGTSICIFDSSGPMGEVSTDMPIVKVDVSKQGIVAAILEDGQNAWIKNYKRDGSEIATLKTTFSTPGYPMDLGLSDDGSLLAVDYLALENGTPISKVAFYNFGTVGQNQKDNLVAETDYRDQIVPEIEYLDENTCVAFGENGFSVFKGSQIPVEDVRVEVEQSIVSTFHDTEYIGLVLQNRDPDYEYLICVYNKKGHEVLRQETDFHYQTIELNGGQVVLATKDEFCVYSMQGVEKYRGALELPASDFLGFGRNKFIYVSEDRFRIIQLK